MTKEEFKDSITLYIDGELSQKKLNEFEMILNENMELRDYYFSIVDLIDNMKPLNNIRTSEDFIQKLNEKIKKDNDSSTFIEKIKDFKIFGFDPLPVISMSAALILSIQIFSNSTIQVPSMSSNEEINVSIDTKNEPTTAYNSLDDSLSSAKIDNEIIERNINDHPLIKVSSKKIKNN